MASQQSFCFLIFFSFAQSSKHALCRGPVRGKWQEALLFKNWGDVCRKILIKPLKETALSMAQAFIDPFKIPL